MFYKTIILNYYKYWGTVRVNLSYLPHVGTTKESLRTGHKTQTSWPYNGASITFESTRLRYATRFVRHFVTRHVWVEPESLEPSRSLLCLSLLPLSEPPLFSFCFRKIYSINLGQLFRHECEPSLSKKKKYVNRNWSPYRYFLFGLDESPEPQNHS